MKWEELEAAYAAAPDPSPEDVLSLINPVSFGAKHVYDGFDVSKLMTKGVKQANGKLLKLARRKHESGGYEYFWYEAGDLIQWHMLKASGWEMGV